MNDGISSIENKIERVIAKWNMLPENCTVIVGLSGGADSMALTHFLLQYANSRHIQVIAAHINHGLRGDEADSDERFVAGWCKENGLELKILHTDVRSLAAEYSEGLEECGRRVRYAFFQSLCPENAKIATAHTLSDSAETVLLNLTKGAGTRGLRGIPSVRGNIVRPLIEITRTEVETYCEFYGLSYVTDSTNLTDEYARNKIRLSVVPVLKEINPAFESAVLGMTRHLSCDEGYLNSLAEEQLANAKCAGGYSRTVLNAIEEPVLIRAIAIAVQQTAKVRLESKHLRAVSELIRAGIGEVTIAGGIQCMLQGNTLFMVQSVIQEKWSIPLERNETALPDGRTLVIAKFTKKEYEKRCNFNNLLFNNLINYDTIFNKSYVRNRRDGDSFRPAGRGITKSLKKLFNEAKLEPILRNRKAMIESGGTIIWIEGFGASQEACVTNNTQNIAEIIIKEC